MLSGLVALHVDDMVCGGTDAFHEHVLGRLKQKYPFRHWKTGSGKFLGRWLEEKDNFFIFNRQNAD